MDIKNKADFYKAVIDITKSTGQGLTDIVLFKVPEYDMYCNELIEEGLLVKMEMSMTTLPNDVFIMPSTGYNVWADEDAMQSLSYIRVFLGADGSVTFGGDKNGELINLYATDLIKMPDFVSGYSEWLTKNIDELNVMLNLDDMYNGPDMCLEPDEIEWVRTRAWYKNNELVSVCVRLSDNSMDDLEKMVGLYRKLIGIYNQTNEQDKVEEANKEISKIESEMTTRKRFGLIYSQNASKNIQDVLQ
jgi:hypothetical protein